MKLTGEIAVPSKINGLEPRPVRTAPSAAVQPRLDQAPGQQAAAAGESEVKLTGRAQQLAALEQSLRSRPAVDEARVAAAKERLMNGDYQIDPQRIADKLLRLENEFQRAAPLERNLLK